MKQLLLLLFFKTACSLLAPAQVLPPDFLCVKGDTLFWELPSNSCGAFNSYDIWFSQNPGGPFVLLASVADPAQDSYFHVNPGGETYYYYLVSNLDCPGEPVISSDTLDNLPPEVSPILSATVEGGAAVLTWQPSPSPEVFAHVIYRQTSIGVVPVDTVFGSASTWTDPLADPQAQSESYFVNALDRCGNTSIFDARHSTIFLEGEVSPCEQAVKLTWNLYENWTGGIGSQELWVGVNGTAPAPSGTVAADASSHTFGNVNDGDTYCFFLRAVEDGSTGFDSKSNQTCLTADVVQAVRDFFIKNATVTPDGLVDVSWTWDPTAEISTLEALRSPENAGYQSVAVLPFPSPLLPQGAFTDADADPGAGKVFYKIQSTDDCDSVAQSTYGSTIFLRGEAQPGNVNLLTWTALDLGIPTSGAAYDLHRILNGAESVVASALSGTSHADPFEPSELGAAGACYYVTASATATPPGGMAMNIQSRSNTACVEQPLRVFVPNAFAPNGFNPEFKPLVVPAEVERYELLVFNRYGEQVFASASPDQGWDGKKGGKDMAQGAYAWRIRLTQGGKTEERSGVVVLLR